MATTREFVARRQDGLGQSQAGALDHHLRRQRLDRDLPPHVDAAAKTSLPPQIDVLATSTLVVSLALLGMATLWQRRRLRT